jgi:hypothetical protein
MAIYLYSVRFHPKFLFNKPENFLLLEVILKA